MRPVLVSLCLMLLFSGAASAQSPLGPKLADMDYAGRTFAATCVKSAVSFKGVADTLKANGFSEFSTGTYYHQKFNLPVKPKISESCSLVAAVRGDHEKAKRAFLKGIALKIPGGAGRLKLDVKKGSDNKAYLVARISKN